MSGKKAEEKRLAALWARVDKAELEAAQEYVNWCRTQLGLPHWIIYIGTTGPCPDDAYADCEANPTRYLAKVRIGRRWPELDVWAQANALLHECLHVSHHQLTEGIHLEVRNALPRKDQRAFNVIEARSVSLDWYLDNGQPAPVESVDSTLPACPNCSGPVCGPGIWVVKGGDYCGRTCAAQAGDHL